MSGTHLPGLEATNPLGFFAALGIQVAFAQAPSCPRLWWTDGVVPHAMVDVESSVEAIAEQVIEVLPIWQESPAIAHGLEPVHDVKFQPCEMRRYLQKARAAGLLGTLAGALVAEGSVDNSGKAKPSPLYFTSGNQLFLKVIDDLIAKVTYEDIVAGLAGPWPYTSTLPTLMWDVVDDRNYALLASDPSPQTKKNRKRTNPGPECLALLGMSRYPVFGSRGRTLTQGTSGGWKKGAFSWPVWTAPATRAAVASILAHASGTKEQLRSRTQWLGAWGVQKVLQAPIRRTDQGGYGSFGPHDVIWEHE
ncbi:type I-G CRISPR-associated protein, Cas3-extension family [Candidatus Poriferisocius sp.]|uniref:type I-G CRISPR-associated protein, Cas3-extension family n=1 Tax=Candidatus Poriferisocius sp. TaxID=3101276 RepID=UPI003B5B02B5